MQGSPFREKILANGINGTIGSLTTPCAVIGDFEHCECGTPIGLTIFRNIRLKCTTANVRTGCQLRLMDDLQRQVPGVGH
jgi:hypothetical protein